jgi:uncharacterized membrane protein
LKEEERRPISELPSESQSGVDPPGGESSAAGGEAEEAGTIPAYIDDEIDRFIKTKVPDLEGTRETHNLDKIVHGLLLGGYVLSTVFIILGLLLSSLQHRQLPLAASSLRQVFEDLKAGAPSGFLNFGILFLIATPILRVLGSLIAFIYGRDWRFAAITSIVLVILAISVLVGRG